MTFLEKIKALSARARQAIGLPSIYTLAETVGEIFFSLYLWRLTNSLALVAQYHFWLWTVFTLGFVVIGYAFKGKGISQLYRLGFLLQFVFYGSLIFLKEGAVTWTSYLGILAGLAAAFYWSAAEVMMLSGSSDKLREMFFAVFLSGEQAARIVGPALAGGLIWLGIKLGGDDLSGYYLLFASLAGLFLSAELVIKKTRDVSFNQFTLTGVFSLYRRRAWRWNLWRSFVDGLMISRVLVWSVLSYLILESETWLGMMMSVVGVLSIISNLLIGHWFKRNLRAKLNTWGVGFLVIAGVLYPLLLSPVGLLADQILGEVVGIPLFTFAWLAWFFLAVETDYEGEKRQFEYYAGHEIWQGAGRMLSIGGFWFLAGQLEQIGLARWWFGGLSLLFIVQWWLVQKVRQALVKAGYKED